MPNFPQPQRQDEPVVTDADLAALLAGRLDVAPGLRPVADVLAALTAEPTSVELTGQASALAEFRRAGPPALALRARRSSAGLTSRFGVKVGASVTAVAVVLGGGAAAAFAGVLPAPIQRLAHEAIGAPIPPSSRHESPAYNRPGVQGVYGGPGMYGRSGVHVKPPARGGPGANRQRRPRVTPTPTPHGNPQGQGNHGNQGKGKGQEGQGSGQGHKGSGQGNQDSGQGNHANALRHRGSGPGNQGVGQRHLGSGQGQVSSQCLGSGQGLLGWPEHGRTQHCRAQHCRAPWGKPHKKGPPGCPRANRRPAGHPRRSVRTRPIMNP